MASEKDKETVCELCSNTASLGNSIAVRMVAFLSTGKREPYHFRQLANEFLDTCTMLYAVSAGLSESFHRNNDFPPDLLTELAKKTRLVHEDFVLLYQKLNKFLEGERKGGFRKFTRRLFADGDIEKLRQSLGNHRDALRISALMFRWSVGEQNLDSPRDSGYTALSAAIRYSSRPESSPAPNPSGVKPVSRSTSMTPSSGPPTIPLPPLPDPLIDKPLTPINSLRLSSEETLDALVSSPLAQSTLSLRLKRRSRTMSPMSSSAALRSTAALVDSKTDVDAPSDVTLTVTPMEDMIHDVDFKEKILPMVREIALSDTSSSDSNHVDTDMSPSPRSTPFGSPSLSIPVTKNALKMAIQQNKHRRIEHLLSHRALADDGLDDNNLRIAISRRDPESVRLILQFGADANGSEEDGFTPLHFATEAPCFKAAKLLLKHGADPNLTPRPDIESPIVMAIKEKKFDFVQLYLRYGAKMDTVLANGDTLFLKVMNKTTPAALVELMLKGGANPNRKSVGGVSPLFAATRAGRLDLVSLLLEAGADPNLPGPEHPLWPSTYQPNILQLLLAKGASHKKTPGILELATSINSLESISILLAAGVNPNTKKDATYTPLCSAIRDNRADIVRMLLVNGADPNLIASEYPAFKCVTHDRAHFLPQLVAAGSDVHRPKGILAVAVAHDNKEALLWLLDQGVSANDRYKEDGGHTALTRAIQDNKSEYVDILLANAGSPAVRGKDWPLLMGVKHPAILAKLLEHTTDMKSISTGVMEAAVAADQLDSIKLLLQAGVSVEDKTDGVFSPLTTAIREHRFEIVKYLLDEAGADPNHVGEHLPIIKAIRHCENRDYRYIDILLEKGADVNKMYRGWNAILQAVELGDMEILELLINKTTQPLDLERVDVES
ncbi:hypothetical protein DV736_g6330, partial [Chaetothyriales sp. CBS 134916]